MESKEHEASETDVLLYQMILFSGEFFQPDLEPRAFPIGLYVLFACPPLSH